MPLGIPNIGANRDFLMKGGAMELLPGILPLILFVLLIVYAVILFLLPIYVRGISKDVSQILLILQRATGEQAGEPDSIEAEPVRFDERGRPIYHD